MADEGSGPISVDVKGMLDLEEIYKDVHRHPELSLQEERTADSLATSLGHAGFDVTRASAGQASSAC